MLTIQIRESEGEQHVESQCVSSKRPHSEPIPVSILMDSKIAHHLVTKGHGAVRCFLSKFKKRSGFVVNNISSS